MNSPFINNYQAAKDEVRKQAPNLSQGACLKLCHELTLSLGGRCADKRTRAYKFTMDELFNLCRRAQPIETLRQWDDAAMEAAANRKVA